MNLNKSIKNSLKISTSYIKLNQKKKKKKITQKTQMNQEKK